MTRETRLRDAITASVWLLVMAAVPVVVWHDLIAWIAAGFRWQLDYLTEWVPWVLLAGGVALLVPVAISSGRPAESRLYPRSRRAYLSWGVVLYLLGLALATQVAEVAALSG